MGKAPQKRQTAFYFVISLHKLLFCFVSAKLHFTNEGIFRFGSPISTDIMFSHFLVHFSLSVKDNEKKSAEGAEDAEAPQAPGGRFFSPSCYGPKINLEKFRNFWEFFALYIILKYFSIEKCLSVQSAFSVSLAG